jgi:NTP pyrophosphatase (non-canonical NTP hydrolase)
MTNHFNRLSEAEAERIALLMEECGEVIQACGKILRHGYESCNPTIDVPEDEYPETNRLMLQKELGDVLHAISRMEDAADIYATVLAERSKAKREKVRKYLHHQEGL